MSVAFFQAPSSGSWEGYREDGRWSRDGAAAEGCRWQPIKPLVKTALRGSERVVPFGWEQLERKAGGRVRRLGTGRTLVMCGEYLLECDDSETVSDAVVWCKPQVNLADTTLCLIFHTHTHPHTHTQYRIPQNKISYLLLISWFTTITAIAETKKNQKDGKSWKI